MNSSAGAPSSSISSYRRDYNSYMVDQLTAQVAQIQAALNNSLPRVLYGAGTAKIEVSAPLRGWLLALSPLAPGPFARRTFWRRTSRS